MSPDTIPPDHPNRADLLRQFRSSQRAFPPDSDLAWVIDVDSEKQWECRQTAPPTISEIVAHSLTEGQQGDVVEAKVGRAIGAAVASVIRKYSGKPFENSISMEDVEEVSRRSAPKLESLEAIPLANSTTGSAKSKCRGAAASPPSPPSLGL